jgi:hypothetical protein
MAGSETVRVIVLAAACALLPAVQLHAQTIRARVIDNQDGRPVPRAEITLVQPDRRVILTSDNVGHFMSVGVAGVWHLRISMLGYVTDSTAVAVSRNELVELTIRLSRSPIQMEMISVNARKPDPRHDDTFDGFLTRRLVFPPIGNRRVVVSGDPEMVNAMSLDEVLAWFPPPTKYCRENIAYFLNGRRASPAEVDFIKELRPAEMAGLEYYRNAIDAPLYMGQGAMCPVVAIWQRRK